MFKQPMARHRLGESIKAGLALFLLAVLILAAGCTKSPSSSPQESAEPAIAEGSCFACHSSSEKLKADLEKDPLPEVAKSTESEGEG